MSQLDDTLELLSPQAHVQIDIDVQLNGASGTPTSRIQLYNTLGVDITELAADIFDAFHVENDGTDETTTVITLTGLSDVMPLRWEWEYQEEEISNPGTYHTITETWDFDGSSATRTFSASTTGRRHIKGTHTFTITAFKSPA